MFGFLVFVILYTLSMALFYFAFTREKPHTDRAWVAFISVFWAIALPTAFIRVFLRCYNETRKQ